MRLNLSADVLSNTRAVPIGSTSQAVEREVIDECLQLARRRPPAPQPGWHGCSSRTSDQGRASEIYRENFTEYRKFAAAHATRRVTARAAAEKVTDSATYLADNFQRVPVMLIPCITGKLDRVPTVHAAGAWGSILPAVWSFMLAARERGLGTAWTTIHMLRDGDKKAAELLGIPDDVTQAGLFPIAYTIGTDFKPAKRLPLDPIVTEKGSLVGSSATACGAPVCTQDGFAYRFDWGPERVANPRPVSTCGLVESWLTSRERCRRSGPRCSRSVGRTKGVGIRTERSSVSPIA